MSRPPAAAGAQRRPAWMLVRGHGRGMRGETYPAVDEVLKLIGGEDVLLASVVLRILAPTITVSHHPPANNTSQGPPTE